MVILFSLTVLLSAALLFLVQPMFARMILPILGGSPAVWNTALVFYQLTLLAGYAYAHFATARLGPRRQAFIHAALVLLAFVSLPIALPPGWLPPIAHNPILWMLGLLAVGVGLPFFVVSTTGPLIQKWLSTTRHPSAKDPYYLYAASNLGSMIGLLGYPLAVEPRLRLTEQSWLWTAGYMLLAVLTVACALVVARQSVGFEKQRSPVVPPLPKRRRLRWVLLAFVPSSLMIGVTTHLTTEIAAMPLFWVVPLAVYLLSFILVFARHPIIPHMLMVRLLPLVVLPLVILLQTRANEPLSMIVGVHLLLLFVAAMVCHGELAKDRPSTEHLTEFYLWLAVGGALGGVFNALIAPVLFRSIVEYPIAIVLVCLVMPPRRPLQAGRWQRAFDVLTPVVLGGIAIVFVAAMRARGLEMTTPAVALLFAALAFPLYAASARPVRFALALAAVLLVSPASLSERSRVLYAERNFFGVNRVMLDGSKRLHQLFHGTTLHGIQRFVPRACNEPLGYYHRASPMGDLFTALDRDRRARTVAVAGLGAGSLAPYARPGDRWTFYEIDPAVERIASDASYFCYLHECPGDVRVVLGDARRSLEVTAERYDVMIFDAYSSDAIPVHLMTREALRLYMNRLNPHGVLAFHLSNRYFDLAPVVGRLAQDAGLVCRVRDDGGGLTRQHVKEGIVPSTYGVIARTDRDLGGILENPRWHLPRLDAGAPTWTDDYSSLLSVLRR